MTKICPACQGTGSEMVYVNGVYLLETCQKCGGSGIVSSRKISWVYIVLFICAISYLIRDCL